jgi:hypothetical protein
VRFLKSSAAFKIMARNHLMTTRFRMVCGNGDCCFCKKHSTSAALRQHF